MNKPTKEEMLNWFDEMWKSATIGDTWKLNKEATQMHLAIRSLIENMDKKVSRKKLAKLAGEFPTLNFSGIHPEDVLEWLIEKFTELGLEVEEKEAGDE